MNLDGWKLEFRKLVQFARQMPRVSVALTGVPARPQSIDLVFLAIESPEDSIVPDSVDELAVKVLAAGPSSELVGILVEQRVSTVFHHQ